MHSLQMNGLYLKRAVLDEKWLDIVRNAQKGDVKLGNSAYCGNGTGNITENASNANPKTIKQKNGGKK